MIPQTAFKSLSDKIIAQTYSDDPAQQLIYKAEGSQLIELLYSGKPIDEFDVNTSMEFGETIHEIVQCVSVVVSTYKMIDSIYKMIKERNQQNDRIESAEQVKAKWLQALQNEKVDPAVAESIVDSFSEDVKDIVKKY